MKTEEVDGYLLDRIKKLEEDLRASTAKLKCARRANFWDAVRSVALAALVIGALLFAMIFGAMVPESVTNRLKQSTCAAWCDAKKTEFQTVGAFKACHEQCEEWRCE